MLFTYIFRTPAEKEETQQPEIDTREGETNERSVGTSENVFPLVLMEMFMWYMTIPTLMRLAQCSRTMYLQVWHWLNRNHLALWNPTPFPPHCPACVSNDGERFPCACRVRDPNFEPVDKSWQVLHFTAKERRELVTSQDLQNEVREGLRMTLVRQVRREEEDRADALRLADMVMARDEI